MAFLSVETRRTVAAAIPIGLPIRTEVGGRLWKVVSLDLDESKARIRLETDGWPRWLTVLIPLGFDFEFADHNGNAGGRHLLRKLIEHVTKWNDRLRRETKHREPRWHEAD